MSTFGEELIQSLNEALAHAKGEGPAIVHAPVAPREVRKQAQLTQAQMAALMGMSLSGYRKWEQGTRRVSGPAATLLRIIEHEPNAVRRTLLQARRASQHARPTVGASSRPTVTGHAKLHRCGRPNLHTSGSEERRR